MTAQHALALPDLASRALGGSVMAASDESFCAKEHLITAAPPTFQPQHFDHRGQIYDGWETARRRDGGHDWAMIRLGAPGVIRSVVIDTAHFKGNFPQAASVEATAVEGYPGSAELAAAEWVTVVPRQPLRGDTQLTFDVADARRFTHVRLSIFPDGGVARLRVHGEVVPDPRDLIGLPVDLAAVHNGGRVTDCSNWFFATPSNILLPGRAGVTGDGWETERRRGGGNDWVTIALTGPSAPRVVEIDTSTFIANAPESAIVSGLRAGGDDLPLLPRTRLQPDTPHRFRVAEVADVAEIRVDILPDGGLARLRVYGALTEPGLRAAALRWYNTLPVPQAHALLAQLPEGGEVAELLSARPVTELPEFLTRLLGI